MAGIAVRYTPRRIARRARTPRWNRRRIARAYRVPLNMLPTNPPQYQNALGEYEQRRRVLNRITEG
jgi:hypothetical protein